MKSDYELFKENINKNKNRTMRIVPIRDNRVCNHCRNAIHKGTECLTVNPIRKERFWICPTCLGLMLGLQDAKARLTGIPYDDEGGAMAMDDYIAELEGQLYAREGTL